MRFQSGYQEKKLTNVGPCRSNFESIRFQSEGYEQNQSKKLTNVGP
jgi:hypothetical protein